VRIQAFFWGGFCGKSRELKRKPETGQALAPPADLRMDADTA